jgi:assimilatory nitrate reductase catalytic subunit
MFDPDHGTQLRSTRSTCPYCGVGCGVIIESRGRNIVGVRGDPDHPSNGGRLCTKGTTLHLSARPDTYAQVRALHPKMRPARELPLARCTWNTALDTVAARLGEALDRYGPDSIGIYASGQLLTEDYYVFNKLARALLQTNNIDTNSRLCMSSSVAGYKMTLGADTVPSCYEDIDRADLLFVAGANPAYAHPVLHGRIEDARRRSPSQRLIVVDPRRTDTARAADLHLAILPGTDVALFHGLLHLLIWDEGVDAAFVAAHTEGFEELKRTVRDYTPQAVAQLCGIAAADLVKAAQWWSSSRAVLSMYCQGLNQSAQGSGKNAALINLHLATGQIGRPGAGPLSLTGQPNAMGGREVGAMATLLAGHRDLADPEHRAQMARLWGVGGIPSTPGLTATELFEAAAEGRIKLLWIVCTNPAQSLPNQSLIRRALTRAECVIVQDAYESTATAAYADLLLPAACWGEKEGTVTNSERRISRVRRAVPAPGEARADWAIGVEVARRLEKRLRPDAASLFPYVSPESIWNEHRETTRGRDLDITGLTYAMLEHEGPQFWPFPEGAASGRARMFCDGAFATSSGRARFAPVQYVPVVEPVDGRYPISLTTGRLRDQWHGMSRTGTVGRLFGHAAEPCVQLHPGDLERRGLQEGDLARVTSRRGAIVLPVQASDDVRRGQAFVAMHWGEEVFGGADDTHGARFGINHLTLDAVDAESGQPELKHAAVRIEPARLGWHYCVFGRIGAARWLTLQRSLRAHFPAFGYCACVPLWCGDDEEGALLLRAASLQPVDPARLQAIETEFSLAEPDTLRYDDSRRSVRRRLRIRGSHLMGAALAGERSALQAEAWLREWFESGVPAQLTPTQLMSSTRPAAGRAGRGRVVCSCLNVAEQQIRQFLSSYSGPEPESALSQALKCGTECGSCRPELKRIATAFSRPPLAADGSGGEGDRARPVAL